MIADPSPEFKYSCLKTCTVIIARLNELQRNPQILSLSQGELEDEIKTLKKRHKTMMSGKNCGHEGLLTEVDQLRNQLQVRNT